MNKEVEMGKIIIKISNTRPQVKFRGGVTNKDIMTSRRVLDFYLPERDITKTHDINDIDIPLGDCNG